MEKVEELGLSEIEAFAQEKFKGNPTPLDKWNEDSSYTQQCINILGSSEVQFNSAFFAVLVLIQHVDRFFCHWEPQTRLDFLRFLQGLAVSKEALLIENHPLLSNYSHLVGSVIAEGWNDNPSFQESLFEINNKICLNILNEVSESMRKLRISSYDDTSIATVIEYSIKQINYPEGDKEINEAALKSILSALNFYALGFNQDEIDDPLKTIINIDEKTQAIITDPQFIEQIFAISQEKASLSFKILTILISCKFNFSTEAKKEFFAFIIKQVSDACSIAMDPEETNQFFLLVLRLKVEIDRLFKLFEYDFKSFLDAVFGKMDAILENPDSYQQNNSAIGTIFLFLETLEEEMYSGQVLGAGYFDSMRIKSVDSFTRSALSILSNGQEIDIDTFCLDKSDHFNPWLMTINRFINRSAPEMLNVLFKLSDEQKSLTPEQLSFICILVMSIIYDTKCTNQEYFEVYVNSYSEAIQRLLTVYRDASTSPYLTNSFLLFLRHYEHFPFLCQPTSFSSLLYGKLKELLNIGDIAEMLQFNLEILLGIFQEIENEYYIYNACKALEYMFKSDSVFHRYVMTVPAVESIIQIRVEKPFPFLLNESHSRVRTEFHRSIATILVNRDAADFRNRYLSIYDTALTEPTQSTAPVTGNIDESLWSYLCDFTGFFKFARQKDDFLIFFSYILSHKHFQALVEHANNASTYTDVILIQLLKFWNALLDNNPRKIQFRHHSENGVMLFRCAVESLQSIIKAAMPVMPPGADKTRKTICYIFRIINSLLVADYVPYNCFDYYNDTRLVDLLVIFNMCLEAAPPEELKQYPKLEKIMMNLNSSICTNHIEATAKPEVANTEIILDIINFGLCSNDSYVRDKALNCLTSFMNFKGEYVQVSEQPDPDSEPNPNAGLTTVIPKEKLILSVCHLWDLLLASPKYNVIICIKEIFCRFSDMAEYVHSKMQEFLIQNQELIELFESSFASFYESCSEMFQSGDTNKFNQVITEFVNNALKCLVAPTKVFSSP